MSDFFDTKSLRTTCSEFGLLPALRELASLIESLDLEIKDFSARKNYQTDFYEIDLVYKVRGYAPSNKEMSRM